LIEFGKAELSVVILAGRHEAEVNRKLKLLH
jgi:hypothetical protein